MRIQIAAFSALAVLTLTSSALAQGVATKTQIVMLGTGAPPPTPNRSGPATAIVVGDRAYIVDAGAGVVRRAAAAAEKGIPALEPTRLSVVFLTHLHSDHTVGLPDLIFTPWVMNRPELAIYGPEGTEQMTQHILQAWGRDIEIRTQGMEQKRPLVVRAYDAKPGVVYQDERVKVTAFPVAHGQWKQAFGYRFDTADRSIVISGDTSPTDEIVRQCHGCDVLIHEVYSMGTKVPVMPDWDSYKLKYHTSTVQLADIAARAKPGLLILYHSGGRAPDEQLLDEVRRTYHGKVVMSHDLDVY